MNKQILWQVSVLTSPDREREAAVLLESVCGQSPSAYLEVRTGKTTVSVYLPKLAPSARFLRERLSEGLTKGERLRVKRLPRQDWAESWKRHFKPLDIGRHLLVIPGWSRRKPRAGQAVVILDPGLSFGTGHHPTTAFCLRQLAACRRPGTKQALLDVGTGSGILAIAGAKLGFEPVTAFDFDPAAVRVARENARKNQIELKVKPRLADLTLMPARGRLSYDVICANLLFDLLRSEAEKLRNRLKAGGHLIVAGVLRKEFTELGEHFAKYGLILRANSAIKEWHSGRFVLCERVR